MCSFTSFAAASSGVSPGSSTSTLFSRERLLFLLQKNNKGALRGKLHDHPPKKSGNSRS